MISKNKIKYIQSLYQKKNREETDVFILEGKKNVEATLQVAADHIIELFATNAWIEANRETIAAIPSTVVEDMQVVSKLKSPQDVLAVVNKKSNTIPQITANSWNIMLDTIQDPGNLGTIIRIADWFGIKNIICSENTVDYYNSKVTQSAMGSIWNVNIIYTDISVFLQEHKNIKVYGAVLDGLTMQDIGNTKEGGFLVIGNEGNGIREDLLPYINKKITIPKFGKAESLNAAVATGILLAHFLVKK